MRVSARPFFLDSARAAASVFAIALALGRPAAPACAQPAPIPIRVVVVTTFELGNDTGDVPGEFQTWVERFPLRATLSFPQGYRPLRYDAADGVLGMVTGEGAERGAASVMALGMDPRFDLSHAYWLVAGIAGVDPAQASVGSAAWASWVVNADLAYEIDPREMPPAWITGIVPLGRDGPYALPAPPATSLHGEQAYRLNPGLAGWAYALTAHTPLVDDPGLQRIRSLYPEPRARRAPFVLRGDTLSGDRYFIGALMTAWAERWTRYWTGGRGTFVTTAEEDAGIMQSLTFLAGAHRVDRARVLVLRTASDYSVPPPGESAAALLASENHPGGYTAYLESLEAAYRVGSVVVRELAEHWALYAAHVP